MKSLKHLVCTALPISILLSSASNATSTISRDPGAHVGIRRPAQNCSEGAIIKNLWLVEQLNITYTSDPLVKPGNASFAITNTLSNTKERLRCTLRANYVCEFKGTPGDASLYIWLQINIDVASFTLNQSVRCATGATESSYAIGTALLSVICPSAEEELSCYGDDDGGGFANGSVTLPAPSP